MPSKIVSIASALKKMKEGGVFILKLDCSKVKETEDSLRECIFEILRKECGITAKDVKMLMSKKCREVRIIISKKGNNCSNCSFLKTHNGCISGVNFKNLSVLATAMA